VVPALLCVVLIIVGVDEPKHAAASGSAKPRWRLRDSARMPAAFWFIVAIATVLTLARFSEAFLVLRAQDLGFSVASAPLVMVVMSVVYAITAYPAGAAADRGRGPYLLAAGLVTLVSADLVMARATGPRSMVAGAALWGLHMGLTQGLLAALVAGAAPADLRGTAFGVFNLACGIALLIASVLAGWLWDAFGPALTFYVGATLTVLAGLGLVLRRKDVAALGRHA
jgi:MFS family permease